MYNLIPLFVILASLLVIIVIVAKKFSVLANLDVENMPAEREAKFKENIASSRIKRNIIKWKNRAAQVSGTVFKGIKTAGIQGYNKLFQVKENYEQELKSRENSRDKHIKEIFQEMEELDPEEDFESMEKKLIDIVGLDPKNVEAFERLGDLYFKNKKFREAQETYQHLLKLLKTKDPYQRAEVYFDLAMVNKSNEDWQQASENIKQAFELAPNNPRYLDIMFEVGIMNKDKKLATTAYNKLSEVNPENKKLEDFKEQLESLNKSS